ncbi:hypothetical protein ACSNOK_34205, partial [Streptomyces sp. URMC 126]
LDGKAGDDDLRGGSGNDILVAGWGNNRLDGGAGVDTADYVSGTAAVNANLAAGTASNTGGAGQDSLVSIENLSGTHYNDVLRGSASANELD